MTAARHSRVVRGLHWATVLALVAGFALIWWRDGLDDGDQRRLLLAWHATLGLAVLMLALGRLARRLAAGRDVPHAALSGWERRLSGGVHLLLYGLLVSLPLLGWLALSSRGRMPQLFGLVALPRLIERDRDLADLLQAWHERVAIALLCLVGLHVAAALFHHLVRRDGVLRSML